MSMGGQVLGLASKRREHMGHAKGFVWVGVVALGLLAFSSSTRMTAWEEERR